MQIQLTLQRYVYECSESKNPMDTEQKGYSQLILFSILTGMLGVIIKLIDGLDANSIVFFRAIIATLSIFLIILFQKRIKELMIVHPIKTLFVGIFEGLSMFLYIASLQQITVSNAVFLLYTAPIFSVILAKFFLNERVEKETIIGIFITLIGIIFILDPRTFSFDSKQSLGSIMALGAGFFYSAMALTAKPLMKKVSGYNVAFWQCIVITFMFLFFLRIDSVSIVYKNWWQLATLGIVCTGISLVLFMEGIKKVKAQKIFIVTALEPLASSVFALIILKEVPSLLTLVGAMLILYGVYRITKN